MTSSLFKSYLSIASSKTRSPYPRMWLQRRTSAVILLSLVSHGLAHSESTVSMPPSLGYTPVTGSVPLYPLNPDRDSKPAVFFGQTGGEVSYAVNAGVGRLVVEVESNGLPADGQTPLKVKVSVYGHDRELLKTPALITIEHSGGRILLPGAKTNEFGPRHQDADRTVPGVQLKVENGQAEFSLLAPDQPQDVTLRVTAGKEQVVGVINYLADLRPMVMAGLLEGVISFRGETKFGPLRGQDTFEREIQGWARNFHHGKADVAPRASFFLKGAIPGDALLTAAFDSDKDPRVRLFRDVNPEAFYTVYGDAGLRSFDAISDSRVYVRIDKDKHYLLFGDIFTSDGYSQVSGQGMVASLKQRSLGNYSRTATGGKLHTETNRLTGNVFGFHDNLHQVVEEFASQGTGPYGLRNNALRSGGEKVEVIVRDRHQLSRIISVRPLQGHTVDYSFEPFSGRILLYNYLPAFDENLNPISLRVTYEVEQGGPRFWVYGGDFQYKLAPFMEFGGSAVHDDNDLSPYNLYSANLSFKLAERTALVLEAAHSRSDFNTNSTNSHTFPTYLGHSGRFDGDAWRVELAHDSDRTSARLFVGRSDPEFYNPSAPLNGGYKEVTARLSYALTPAWQIYADGEQSENTNPKGEERKAAGTGLRWQATNKLTLDLGWRHYSETVGVAGTGLSEVPFSSTLGLTGSILTGAGGGALGYGSQQVDPITGLPIIRQGTLQPSVSNLAPGTHLASNSVRFGAGYRLTERFTVGAEAEHDVSGDERRRYALGADLQVAERTKLYSRYERQLGWSYMNGVTGRGPGANALVFGIDTTYLSNTQAYSEYRLRDSFNSKDIQIASGLRNVWALREGLRLTTAVEHVNTLKGVTPTTNAVSIGVDYTANPLWRTATRIEVRHSGDIPSSPVLDERFTTTLWQGMVARKLDRDWTLLGRDYLLYTDYKARGSTVQNRAQLGLAYRDTDTNRVNALAKIEHKLESDGSQPSVGSVRSSAYIASMHADWHPSRPWWLTGRITGKWQNDRFEYGSHDYFRAQLVAGRVVYDITENWDIGALVAGQFGKSQARQYAVGTELGYLLRQNLWLSAGYNLSGFDGDRDLRGYEYTRRGAYLRLRFKFDESILP